ncbi:hypothetical protein [Salibacterium halotolerans]|uniref:Uncharacterized protein n=1 Tax=Salibacterium halotolerans TaxID=1884432 RepID=A0A1I5TV76_9BACI|nr:hypothetical protein [Salibacterium halotolerans]SFP86982.1 hypothetical protein SAMN05518683_111109 [Salibacterium halotolerans]
MTDREPVHLYLSRYQEHIAYLQETGQESPGWRELREEELPGFLQVKDSRIQVETESIVRDYAEEGSWKQGDMLHMRLELTDGTELAMHGYYVPSREDWYPDENPMTHKSSWCGYCQSIIGLMKQRDLEGELCMLPLPEKKYLFETVLRRHQEELYE